VRRIHLIIIGSLLAVTAKADDHLAKPCAVSVRLVEALKEGRTEAEVNPEMPKDEASQLRGLPYGRFQTLSQKSFETPLGKVGVAELPRDKSSNFHIEVTPHSLVDGKVHYTLEWKAPGEESIVATKLGVENGRNVMIGGEVTCKESGKRSLIVGVRVKCTE